MKTTTLYTYTTKVFENVRVRVIICMTPVKSISRREVDLWFTTLTISH